MKIDVRIFKLEEYPGLVIRTTSTSYVDRTIVFCEEIFVHLYKKKNNRGGREQIVGKNLKSYDRENNIHKIIFEMQIVFKRIISQRDIFPLDINIF